MDFFLKKKKKSLIFTSKKFFFCKYCFQTYLLTLVCGDDEVFAKKKQFILPLNILGSSHTHTHNKTDTHSI